jgi:hypothetical protein
LSRRWSWSAATVVAAGGGFGVYAYGHIGLSVLVLALPVAAVSGWITSGVRAVPRAVARVTAASAVGAVLALPTLRRAYALVRAQSDAVAGWPLPPMNPFRALFWPQGLMLPSSGATTIVTWVVVLVALLGAIAVAARQSSQRRSAVLAGIVLLGAAIVVAGAAWVYGPERYQSWKMLQLLMPVALVAALPAVGLVAVRGLRVGAGLLAGLAGAALLGPWLQWQGVLAAPESAVVTGSDLAASVDAIQARDVAAINVRLTSYNQTMMAGAMLSDTAVVLSAQTYYSALASTRTCTLTLRSMVSPDDPDVIPLSGDYVLVERPSTCLVRR